MQDKDCENMNFIIGNIDLNQRGNSCITGDSIHLPLRGPGRREGSGIPLILHNSQHPATIGLIWRNRASYVTHLPSLKGQMLFYGHLFHC
jgi:hypothetical protein